MVGNAAFCNNSAEYGGAMNTYGATTIIDGTAIFSSNTALTGGAIYSSQRSQLYTPGSISFVENSAFSDGGAMYITDPHVLFNISGVTFIYNKALSGGAVSLTSSEEISGAFHYCQFNNNNASSGGAMYLSSAAGNVSVSLSNFSCNVAAALGGALFNAGELFVDKTFFSANAAGGEGLAIYNYGSSHISLNATFDGNMKSCPIGEYSAFEEDPPEKSSRFNVVCARCSNGGERILGNVKIDDETVPGCRTIPTGVHTSSAGLTLAEFNLKKGYYRDSNASRLVLECYQPSACTGGTDATDYCAAGYKGPYCAVCANGTAPGIMRLCHECSEDIVRSGLWVLVVLFILVTTVVAIVGSHLLEDVNIVANHADSAENKARVQGHPILWKCRNFLAKFFPPSAVRIVVVVLEIITQFTEVAGNVYPDEYEKFVSTMAISNLDIGFILSCFCIVKTNFYDRLLIATVGPLILLLALASTFTIAKRKNRNSETAVAIVKLKHLSIVLFVTFILYSSISFTIFQAFICNTLDGGGEYLRADLSISCKTEEYKKYRLYATFMLGVYPVGVPAVFGWWLVRNREKLQTPGRETIAHLKPFRGLWAAYRPARYYYEIVEYGRRFMLTGASVFVVPGSSAQIAAILLLAVVFMFISESLSPFHSTFDLWLYRWGNAIIFASMYVALLLSVEVTEDGNAGTHAVAALLISANVVMILAIVVQGALALKGMYSHVGVQQVDFPRRPRSSVRIMHEDGDEGLEMQRSID